MEEKYLVFSILKELVCGSMNEYRMWIQKDVGSNPGFVSHIIVF